MSARRGVALGLALAALAACSRAPQPGERPRLEVLGTPRLASAPLLLAMAGGDFEAAGVTIDLKRLDSSTDMLPLLDAGKADIAAMAANATLFNAVARGARLRIAAERAHLEPGGCVAFALLARPEVARGGSLRGRSVALLRGGLSGYALDLALAGSGVRPDELQRHDAAEPMIPEMLASGRLDLAVTSEPWVSLSVARGAVVLRNLAELLPGFSSGILIFGPRLLDAPDTAQRFLTGYRAGIARYLRGKTPENVAALATGTGLEPAVIEQACWPPVTPDGAPAFEPFRGFAAWLQREGLTAEVIAPEALRLQLPAAR